MPILKSYCEDKLWGKERQFKGLPAPLAMSAEGVVKRTFEHVLSNSKLRQAISRVVGKAGNPRFRLFRDTVGVMAIQAPSMGLGFPVSVLWAGTT